MRRILRESHTLPILTAICIAILAEVYTTDYDADTKYARVRMKYRSSPIADFGIATGAADVKNQDKLAYLDMETVVFTRGQDPNEHYWIYVTTIRGEKFVLDLAMFTFNLCMMVPMSGYLPPELATTSVHAPAFFQDRTVRNSLSVSLHKERRRISVLRCAELYTVVAHFKNSLFPEDSRTICQFIERISGRKLTKLERDLGPKWTFVAKLQKLKK